MRHAAATALCALLSGCAADSEAATGEARWVHVPPPRPASCRDVPAGDALRAAVAAAAPGDALCLAAGRHVGPVVVKVPLTLWGPREAEIVAPSGGTVIALRAPGARLLGVTVDGRGGSFDRADAAVHGAADDVVVEGVTVIAGAYGIVLEQARRGRVAGNRVRGATEDAVGQRGDTIRLWETDDAVLEGNLIEDGRDLVVWYSRGAVVRGNHVRRGRYGTHFMYSHRTAVTGNRYTDVTVGVFVMYSRDVRLEGNLIANAAGAAGIAIGLKDAGSVRIADNLLVRDEVGIYLDATPQRRDERVEITGNSLHFCRTAVAFHATPAGVAIEVTGNNFGGNHANARIDGGGDALGVRWEGNWFEDYAGYDLDGDGTGDVPYELRSFSGSLLARRPELAFFRDTPALALTDAAAHLDPLFPPRRLLSDPRPRMDPITGSPGDR